MGAHVILACRSAQRGEATRQDITDGTAATSVSVISLDLSSQASVRAFAAAFDERFAKLDVLVNNGAASLPTREVTPEGFERHWATNVLGPYLLTTLLIPALRASGGRTDRHRLHARGRRPRPLRHSIRATALPRHLRLPRVQASRPHAHLGPGRQAHG